MKATTKPTPPAPRQLDARYTFSYEYCGYETPRHIARFCDSWIGQSETLEGAQAIALAYEALRWPPPPTPNESPIKRSNFKETFGNPFTREVTKPGRTDGCRVFERADGCLTVYDPRHQTIPAFQAATGQPLPPFPPSPALDVADLLALTPGPAAAGPQDLVVSLDDKARLYCIRDHGSISHWGYDVIARKTKALNRALDRLGEFESGTIEAYQLYTSLMATAKARYDTTGKPFEFELSPQLTGLEGRRVEVRDQHGDAPRRFTVGKSTGWIPCHLELATSRTTGGGPARLEYATVTIID